MIALKNVSKAYGKKAVLTNLSLRIDPGASLCVLGDSASGKTTLMRLLIRADDPDEGSVDVDGVNIRTLPAPILQLYRRRVGVIYQESVLLNHATVEENVGLPLELLGAPEALIRRNTNDLLKRMNLLSKATLFPQDLSVSERSLVCIARAIITAPMVILADEPLQNLDSAQSNIVIELLTNMRKKGTTLAIFSREAAVARAFDATVVHLKNGNTTKQAEPEKAAHKKPADAHRLLEESDEVSAEFSMDIPDGDSIVPVSHKKTGGGGKRIRITSIGSNS
ncbi:ATP-binding cassette domain-containing protein [Candidatus Peribacteria bacterium]|nr:MAG: ATP-binding cassette domain-containing protein [Candidatus Peribacteria bacterium]